MAGAFAARRSRRTMRRIPAIVSSRVCVARARPTAVRGPFDDARRLSSPRLDCPVFSPSQEARRLRCVASSEKRTSGRRGCPGGATRRWRPRRRREPRAGARRTHRAREPPRAPHPPASLRSASMRARAAEDAPPRTETQLEADDSAARPTAVARLTASLGASTSTRRDVHVDRRADTKAARRERRDAKHARELGPHLGSANPPASVDAAMSREMAAMAGGVDALARRARDLALADERNLEVALRLASAAADVAAEELRDASLEAETDLDWPESSSSSADFLDAGSGSFHGSFDDASRTAAAARGMLSATRTRTAVRRIRRPTCRPNCPNAFFTTSGPRRSPHSPRRIGAAIGRNPG